MLIYQRSALAAAFVASTLATSSGTLCAGEPAPHLAFQILTQDSVSNEDRKVVAKVFETFCGKLNGKIPTLSPRENDWLNAEIEAGRGLSLKAYPAASGEINILYVTGLLCRPMPRRDSMAAWQVLRWLKRKTNSSR